MEMNITFFINDISGVSGTQRVCSQISSELAHLGYAVSIISIVQRRKLFFQLDSKVSLYALFSRRTNSVLENLTVPYKLRKKLKQAKTDIVICVDSYYCSVVCAATIFSKIRHVAWEQFHCEISTFMGRRWIGRHIASRFCDKVVVLTDTDRSHWQEKYVIQGAINSIHNPSPYRPLARVDSYSNRLVLAAGRFVAEKGFDLLLEAWARLPAETRTSWKLRIVGPRGGAIEQIEAFVRTHQLSDSVELVVGFNNMTEEYPRAGIFVMSSRYEGFGLTLIEAMSFGLPVIAFDCPMGPKEILANNSGILVKMGDTTSLADTILELINNVELRTAYAKCSLARSADFAPEAITKQWVSLLNSLASKG